MKMVGPYSTLRYMSGFSFMFQPENVILQTKVEGHTLTEYIHYFFALMFIYYRHKSVAAKLITLHRNDLSLPVSLNINNIKISEIRVLDVKSDLHCMMSFF
jgi:hypothetical protein